MPGSEFLCSLFDVKNIETSVPSVEVVRGYDRRNSQD